MSTSHFSVDPAQRVGKRVFRIPSTLLRAGLPALALVVVLAACDSSGGEEFNISTYTGEPYTGEVETTATTPEGDVEVLLGANASIEVDNLGEGQASFTVHHGTQVFFSGEGSYDANGASFLEGGNEIELDADGDITANVTDSDLDFSSVSGRMTSSTVDLELVAELSEDFGDLPAGTEIRSVYVLDR